MSSFNVHVPLIYIKILDLKQDTTASQETGSEHETVKNSIKLKHLQEKISSAIKKTFPFTRLNAHCICANTSERHQRTSKTE